MVVSNHKTLIFTWLINNLEPVQCNLVEPELYQKSFQLDSVWWSLNAKWQRVHEIGMSEWSNLREEQLQHGGIT